PLVGEPHGRAGGGPARRREVRRLHSAREGTDLRPAARARAHPQATTRSGAGETSAAAGTLVTRRAAEAAARRLPLKQQCSARLRATAESRVHSRTWRRCDLLLPDPLHRAAEAAARRLPLKRQGRVSSLTRAESRVHPRT